MMTPPLAKHIRPSSIKLCPLSSRTGYDAHTRRHEETQQRRGPRASKAAFHADGAQEKGKPHSPIRRRRR